MTVSGVRTCAGALLLLAAAGCDDFTHPAAHIAASDGPAPAPASVAQVQATAPVPATTLAATAVDPVPAQAASPPAAAIPPPTAALAPSQAAQAQAIETAASADGAPAAPLLIRAEVLLDRAHFSPGQIDGQMGSNLRGAITAYRTAHRLAGNGLDVALLSDLTGHDAAPITQDYVLTADDEKGPFLGVVPTDMAKMATLDRLGYATPLEGLAEKFHMSQGLLRALNPTADFAAAGGVIVVVRPSSGDIPPVARVEVDKAANAVRAMDESGKVVAVFPATVGSTERPAPSGEWAVKTVVRNPNYTYDPKRLTFGDTAKGVLTLPPGPNNPVGSTWIALTKDTYGIHGTPDPTLVG